MDTILTVLVFFALGLVVRAQVSDTTHLVKWANLFIIYFALPCIILLKVPQLTFSREVLLPASFPWIWMIISIFIVLVICRSQSWPAQVEGAMLLLVTLGNSSFLGYSLVLAVFGDAALGYAIFYDQLGTFLVLNTFGLSVIAIYGPTLKGENPISLLIILKRILSFPPFIALMVAVLLPIDWQVLTLGGVMNLAATLLMQPLYLYWAYSFKPDYCRNIKRPWR